MEEDNLHIESCPILGLDDPPDKVWVLYSRKRDGYVVGTLDGLGFNTLLCFENEKAAQAEFDEVGDYGMYDGAKPTEVVFTEAWEIAQGIELTNYIDVIKSNGERQRYAVR